MRRRPRRRPPTLQELFLGFCFCILAVSIAWNMLPHQSLRELAYGVRDVGIKTVKFPGGGEPSGAVRAALIEHAARTGRKAQMEAGAPAQSQAEKEAARGGKWGTALIGN